MYYLYLNIFSLQNIYCRRQIVFWAYFWKKYQIIWKSYANYTDDRGRFYGLPVTRKKRSLYR